MKPRLIAAAAFALALTAHAQDSLEVQQAMREIWRGTLPADRINSDAEAVRTLSGIFNHAVTDTGSHLYLFPDHSFITENWWMGGTETTQEGAWAFEDGLIRLFATWSKPRSDYKYRDTYIAWYRRDDNPEIVLWDDFILGSMDRSKLSPSQVHAAFLDRKFSLIGAYKLTEPLSPKEAAASKASVLRKRSNQEAWKNLGARHPNVASLLSRLSYYVTGAFSLDHAASSPARDAVEVGAVGLLRLAAAAFGVATFFLGVCQRTRAVTRRRVAIGAVALILGAIVIWYDWSISSQWYIFSVIADRLFVPNLQYWVSYEHSLIAVLNQLALLFAVVGCLVAFVRARIAGSSIA